MIKMTLNAAHEISPVANVAVVPYYPMPSIWVLIRAILGRNPRIPNVTASEITELSLAGGAGYALNAIAQANSDRNTFATTIAMLNLTRLDRGSAINAAEAELARRGTTLPGATSYLATSTVQETAFMSIINSPTRRPERARSVLGGGYTAWNFAGPLVTNGGILSAMGGFGALSSGVTPSSYMPFVNAADDGVMMSWITKLIMALEFPAYQGMALSTGFDLNKYLDNHLSTVVRARLMRAGLAVQPTLGFIRPWLDLASQPGVRSSLMATNPGPMSTMFADMELIRSQPMSRIAWYLCGGSSKETLYGHARDAFSLPSPYNATLAGYFGPAIRATIADLAACFRDPSFNKMYKGMAAAGGWSAAEPLIPLTSIIALNEPRPVYTDHYRVLQNGPLDLRGLPYVLLRSQFEDSTANMVSGASTATWNQNRPLSELLARRPSAYPMLVTDAHPDYRNLGITVSTWLRAIRPLEEYRYEDYGIKLGDQRVFGSPRIVNVSTIAAELRMPENLIRQAILAGEVGHLFAGNDPNQPKTTMCYMSELTWKRAEGSAVPIPDARPHCVWLYETGGQYTIGGPAYSPAATPDRYTGTYKITPEPAPADAGAEFESLVDSALSSVLAKSSLELVKHKTDLSRLADLFGADMSAEAAQTVIETVGAVSGDSAPKMDV